jgi:uncharacterized oligopeptide transporter (OPT) family protein
MARAERKSLIEKTAELSKKIDYLLIALGSGIYILFNKSVGAAVVIGSVLTIIPAQMIQRWAKKRKKRS